MEKKIRKEVDAEVQEALKAPEPNLNMLTEHILLEVNMYPMHCKQPY